MVKLYRGDVILVTAPAGERKVKPRPVILLHDVTKNTDIISVYCTSQNDGDDANAIFVAANSSEGNMMGLTKDTYVRPKITLNLSRIFLYGYWAFAHLWTR